MAAELWALIAVIGLFLIIIATKFFVVLKKTLKDKSSQPKKEKKVKEKKEKVEKEKKEKVKKEKTAKIKYQRPMDIARAKLKERQEAEKLRKEQEAEERAKTPKLGEGESDNVNYQDRKEEKEVAEVSEKQKTIADEIKALSPEMKALIFGDTLDRKN